MSRKVSIDKLERFWEDSIDTIKEDYVRFCNEKKESPSVVGMLRFLKDKDFLDKSNLLKNLFDKRIILKKPYEVVKELSKKYGIKQKTLWNFWERKKIENGL